MKSLFEKEAYEEIMARLQALQPDSPRRWGKMTASKMMAHLGRGLQVALAEKPMKRMFIGYILGPLMKHQLYNDTPWKQSLPTSPDFIIRDEGDFETEKQKLVNKIRRLHEAGPQGAGQFPHPFFGKLTAEQWGKSMYKHVDHHLRQFNA